jgi:ATP-binding cassette subfamily G (WHITE) protein 2 (SNQ2)
MHGYAFPIFLRWALPDPRRSADPNERQMQEGRDETSVPSTPEALEQAFKASDIHARMIQEREEYRALIAKENTRREDFVAAVQADKNRAVGKKSPYTVSFFTQVKALAIRQFQLKMQDRLDLYVSFTTTIIGAGLRARFSSPS